MKTNIFIIYICFLIFIKVKSIFEDNKKQSIIMNIYYNSQNKGFKVEESLKRDENAVASAFYNKSYESTGWDILTISSYEKDDKYSDAIKSYAMGYLEGYLTKDRIFSYYNNIFYSEIYNETLKELNIPKNLANFFEKNIEYMEKKSLEEMKNSLYWEHVHYIYQQLKGLYEGYNDTAKEYEKIDFLNFLIMPAYTDSTDVINHYESNKVDTRKMTVEQIENYTLLNSHCSALVKLAEDSSDIWFGHNTWNHFYTMIRIFKEYRFVSNKGGEKCKTVAFPSYPATLFSLDDYYYLDSNLLVFETTNKIYGIDLFKSMSPNSLFTWVREILSNRLASSAKDWAEIFKKENSGTYNNQFVILDLNKIKLKNGKISNITNETLMIIEQIPNYTEINDVSYKLREGYFPSYNIPFSTTVYEKSGYLDAIKKFWVLNATLDYNNCSRAKIFKREQSKIKSNKDFEKLLRFNNYKLDEFSNNQSNRAIASRSDLDIFSLCYGAIDAKYVSVKELLEGKKIIHIISGPTNEQQPTFSWKNATCISFQNELRHDGVVDTWNFPWIDYQVQLMKKEKENNSENKNNKVLFIIVFCVGIVIIIILVIILILVSLKKSGAFNKLRNEVNKVSFAEDEDDKMGINEKEDKEKEEDVLI